MTKSLIPLVVSLIVLPSTVMQAAPADETKSIPQVNPDALRRWQDMRFGMFIHWGPVSLKGTEIGWSRGGPRRGHGEGKGSVPVEEYDNLYKQFNPVEFNAREWAGIA